MLDVRRYYVSFDMKGCICHFVKWQIHPFISKGTIIRLNYMKRLFYAFLRDAWPLPGEVAHNADVKPANETLSQCCSNVDPRLHL